MEAIIHSLVDMVSPKPTALIPVADGCEDIETAVLADILMRGGVLVTVATVHCGPSRMVTLQQGSCIEANKPIEYCTNELYDVIVIPGGPGAKVLGACHILLMMLQQQKAAGKLYGAIGTAPVDVLFSHAGLISGEMTCSPLVRDEVETLYVDNDVVVTDNCITSQSPGTAVAMALKIVELLRGESMANKLRKAVVVS